MRRLVTASRAVVWDRHSSTAWEAATLGGRTLLLASRSIPAVPNSLTDRGKSMAVALIRCRSGSEEKLTTNSPVSSTFRNESLRPMEVNWTIGGSVLAMLKKECGARFSVSPSGVTVETQAIGRGTTTEVSSR